MACPPEAIEAAYRRRFGGFCLALLGLAGSVEAAQDHVQEGFARALASRGSYRGGSLDAWVWKAILRVALDARRRAGRTADIDAPADTVDDVLGGLDPALAAAVRALSVRQRQMIFLRYFADLTQAEIAEACDVAPGTVAATLTQARVRLAAELQEVPT